MNVLGRAAQHLLPSALPLLLLRKLYTDTAVAFGRPPPSSRGLSTEAVLRAYAEFTAAAAGTPTPEVTRRVFEVSFGYGKWLRRVFGIASTQDVMAAARLVYRGIGIDFEGTARGEVVIRSCYFSRFYSPEVCRAMSALDAGLLAGLSNGRRLVFSQRITEGNPCCRANLATP
jgi:hypothetical protein